jgi:hypothetical protein
MIALKIAGFTVSALFTIFIVGGIILSVAANALAS